MKKLFLTILMLLVWCGVGFAGTSQPVYGLSKTLDMWTYTTTADETYTMTIEELPFFMGKLVYSVEVSGGDPAYTVTLADTVGMVIFTSTTCNSTTGTSDVGINQPIWGKLTVTTSGVGGGTVTVRVGLWK